MAVAGVAVFGAALFVLSFFNRKMNVGVVSSGGLYDISGKLRKSVDAEIEKSKNILNKPVKVRFLYDESSGELTLKDKLKVRKKKLDNVVFFLKQHGEMLYSEDFASDDENIFCRGVMKKGEDFFFIYFCSDKRD